MDNQAIRRRRDGTTDQDEIKDTNGENTQDIVGDQDENEENANLAGQDDDTAMGRSYSLSQQKSVKSTKTKKVDEEEDEMDNNSNKYLYRAVGSEKSIRFHANINEIQFDLIGLMGGYYLRIEIMVGKE